MTLRNKLGTLGTLAILGAGAIGCVGDPKKAVITSEEYIPRKIFFGTDQYTATLKFLDGQEGYMVYYGGGSRSVDSLLNVGDTITVVKLSGKRDRYVPTPNNSEN